LVLPSNLVTPAISANILLVSCRVRYLQASEAHLSDVRAPISDWIGAKTHLWLFLGTFIQALFTMAAAISL
jgi:hypothetical protein